MFRKITLEDVAQRAGVRRRTVSNTLHDQTRVTPDVHQCIFTAVKPLGHRPNRFALNLRLQSTDLIGSSWKSWWQNFFRPLLEQCQRYMAEAVEQLGYRIPLSPQRPTVSPAGTYRGRVFTQWADGFIISSLGRHDPDIPILQPYRPFRNHNMPTLARLVAGDGQQSFTR